MPATRHNVIDIPVDGQHIAGTLVAASTMVPGVLLVHGWDGSQEQYIARAHDIAALGCVCLTFDLRGHARHAALRKEVTREDNLRDVLAACEAFTGDVLIVESEHDQIVPHPVIENYLGAFKRVRSATYRVISGADHALSKQSSRQAYGQLLVSWMTEMTLGARATGAMTRAVSESPA